MLQKLMYNLLFEPSVKACYTDDRRLTEVRKSIIQEKKFLRAIYLDWYQMILQNVPAGEGPVFEMGSGAGFIQQLCPQVFQSDIFWCSNVQAVLDGCALPLKDGSLKAILLNDVLHHIPEPRRFLTEAVRCLKVGGAMVMIEPWVTTWSKLIYNHLHAEPINMHATTWEFDSSGPLSGANIALPWIIFERDKDVFQKAFPQFKLLKIDIFMPFLYLLSGGVSLKKLAPDWSYGFWKSVEKLLSPWSKHLGMFALIALQKAA